MLMEKSALRKQLLASRKNLAAGQRLWADRQISQSLLNLPAWQNARTVGCYISLPDEVQTQDIIRQGLDAGKIIAAPVVEKASASMQFYLLNLNQNLQPGPMGIFQPPRDQLVPPEDIDLLVMPGLGFDLAGHRLGYGGGFYDRYLVGFPGITLGLAYDLQVKGPLPVTSRDQPIQILVTETRILHFL